MRGNRRRTTGTLLGSRSTVAVSPARKVRLFVANQADSAVGCVPGVSGVFRNRATTCPLIVSAPDHGTMIGPYSPRPAPAAFHRALTGKFTGRARADVKVISEDVP